VPNTQLLSFVSRLSDDELRSFLLAVISFSDKRSLANTIYTPTSNATFLGDGVVKYNVN
jgi:hypothetical protein